MAPSETSVLYGRQDAGVRATRRTPKPTPSSATPASTTSPTCRPVNGSVLLVLLVEVVAATDCVGVDGVFDVMFADGVCCGVTVVWIVAAGALYEPTVGFST